MFSLYSLSCEETLYLVQQFMKIKIHAKRTGKLLSIKKVIRNVTIMMQTSKTMTGNQPLFLFYFV